MHNKLTDKDIEELKDYMKPYFNHLEITENLIDAVYSYFKDRKLTDLKDFYILYRGNHKNLKNVYDFFIKEKDINAFEYCEKHLSNNSSNSHLLNFFRVSVDAKKYSPSDKGREELIRGFRHVNKADFDNLLKIALGSEDKILKFNNFLEAINKQKSFHLTALHEEKINRLFTKNFPHASSEDKEKLSKLLPSLHKNTYLEEDSGYFYRLKIDCDILSKSNKISATNNSIAISNFFKSFNKHIQNNEILGLKLVEVMEDNSFLNKKTISFHFHDDSDLESKKSLISNLLNYCLENDRKTLKGGGTIKDDDTFFNSFVMHEKMIKNLADKPGKTPKTKI